MTKDELVKKIKIKFPNNREGNKSAIRMVNMFWPLVEAAREARTDMAHAMHFISTRGKMRDVGVYQFAESAVALEEAINALTKPQEG